MIAKVICIVAVLSGIGSAQNIKQWLPSLNFDNPDNWNLKRLPCSNDVVRILDSDTAVYMQSNFTIKELILPVTGEVVLGSDVMLAFSDAPDPTPGCSATSEEVKFVRELPETWYDPLNWCVTNSTSDLCHSPLNKLDLLDTEHVPCAYDTAFFPPSREFYVDLGNDSSISVGTLVFGEMTYSTTDSFKQFLQTSGGLKQFTSPNGTQMSQVTILNKNQCTDITGCTCGNDNGQVRDKICSFVSLRCQPVNCSKPFLAVGGCCPTCGALLELEYGGGFRMDKLKKFLTDDSIFTQVQGMGDIQTVVSKTYEDKIQLVFTDRVAGRHAEVFGKEVQYQLTQDIKGDRKLGLVSSLLTISKDEPEVLPTSAPSIAKKGGLSSGTIVGIVVAVVLTLTIVAAIGCFIYRRKLGQPFLPFLNPLSKSTEIELGPSVSFENGVVEIDASLRGFDNPMYDSPMAKDHEPTFFQDPTRAIPDMKYTNGNSITAFSNPVYSQEGLEEDTDL